MQFKDYYEILCVEPGAGEAEIKTALAEIARQLQEQLAFYGAIGIGDIGNSQAGPQPAAPETLTSAS